jgi:D-alanyl-lipoteichoic acid acyltransferase DltB (MBOAT superfamily)
LIAGPILHHKEMMPQFAQKLVCKINPENIAIGLSIFVLGLAKKVLLADSLSALAGPLFTAAKAGGHPMLFQAWTGALSYTLQLYFDFSGYSDMAIGLSLMFNVRLPLNFDSPYKSVSIIEFWRRWHMTLSRFLRDYLYIPLGGNRRGKPARYLNLMATMLLGGLWHGASWTFVIWGGLHGGYLLLNHAWREIRPQAAELKAGLGGGLLGWAVTFIAVVVSWVFFRAENFSSARLILQGMAGLNGRMSPGTDWIDPLQLILPCLGLVLFFPNVRQLFQDHKTVCDDDRQEGQKTALTSTPLWVSILLYFFRWRPGKWQAMGYGALFFVLLACMASLTKSEFIYFQF